MSSKCILERLKVKNPTERDGDVSFDETSHSYTLLRLGRKFPNSVTGLVKKAFKDDFNAKAIVEKNMHTWSTDPESKYFALVEYLMLTQGLNLEQAGKEIIKLWNAKGLEARTLGTRAHLEIEYYMNGGRIEDPRHEYATSGIDQALKTSFFPHLKLRPFRSEMIVYLTTVVKYMNTTKEILHVCGCVDAIFEDEKGRLFVVDWKRTSKSLSSAFFKPGCVFEGYSSDDLNKYAMQLRLYVLMLRRGNYFPGRELSGAFVCQVHPSLPYPKFTDVDSVSCPDTFDGLVEAFLDKEIEKREAAELEELKKQMEADTEEDEDEGEGEEKGTKRSREEPGEEEE